MTNQADKLLVAAVRRGEPEAWGRLIARYEGRLLAFVDVRLRDRQASEDVVQETFVGFLTSLPNYDERRPLESYLFSIAAHKLTDHLRREGRRPTVPLAVGEEWSDEELPGPARRASSMARSRERKSREDDALTRALRSLVREWMERGQWERLKCMELLWVRGRPNQEAARRLGISEQAVANHKFAVTAKLKERVGSEQLGAREGLGASEEGRRDAGTRGRGDVRIGDASVAAPPVVGPSDDELLAYADESLAGADAAEIERRLRDDASLVRRLQTLVERRGHGPWPASPGEIWRRERLSCPTRDQLGLLVLQAIDPALGDYVKFHIEVAGCRWCEANLADLREQHAGAAAEQAARRQRKFFESSAGALSRRAKG